MLGFYFPFNSLGHFGTGSQPLVGIEPGRDHITMGSFMGTGNQFIQLVKVLYCTLVVIGKKIPAFPHMVRGLNHRTQR